MTCTSLGYHEYLCLASASFTNPHHVIPAVLGNMLGDTPWVLLYLSILLLKKKNTWDFMQGLKLSLKALGEDETR